jgi:glycosyltransferase involved in cell wall biosynthesis
LNNYLVWAGESRNMGAVQNALDIATSSSSFGEGLSNAIGEAMACGVPCVVTDVGDSAILVGATGLVVPPGEPAAMAAAWKRLLDMPAAERAALGRAARQRIVEEYSIEQLVGRTESALAALIAHAPETRITPAD